MSLCRRHRHHNTHSLTQSQTHIQGPEIPLLQARPLQKRDLRLHMIYPATIVIIVEDLTSPATGLAMSVTHSLPLSHQGLRN